MATGWDYLIQGKIFDSFVAAFNSSIGGSTVFYFALMFSGLVLIYIKNENLGVASTALMLVSGVLIPFVPPELQIYFWVSFLLGIASSLYVVFRSMR